MADLTLGNRVGHLPRPDPPMSPRTLFTTSPAGAGGTSPVLSDTSLMQKIARNVGVRFVIVGGVSFFLDAGTLFLLHGVWGMWLGPATALAFLTAFFLNFLLNR